MAERYVPIVIMMAVALGFAAFALGVAWLLGPAKPDRSKVSPYECGVPPIGTARERYSVRFYVIAMLFIVFDLETVFLFPWAVIFRQNAPFFFFEMLVFLGILIVGYVYVWRMGALDWNTRRGRLLWDTERESGVPAVRDWREGTPKARVAGERR